MCPFYGRERPWKQPWWLFVRTFGSERSSFRLIMTQESLRYHVFTHPTDRHIYKQALIKKLSVLSCVLVLSALVRRHVWFTRFLLVRSRSVSPLCFARCAIYASSHMTYNMCHDAHDKLNSSVLMDVSLQVFFVRILRTAPSSCMFTFCISTVLYCLWLMLCSFFCMYYYRIYSVF